MEIELGYRAPLDGEGLIGFFGDRAVAGVEQVEDGVYRRSVRFPGGPGVIDLRPANGHVAAHFFLVGEGDRAAAETAARRVFDLDADPGAIGEALGGDALIGPLARANAGRRVPGHVDPDELAIRAVLGQQVSLAAAAAIAGRLVAAHGEPLARPRGAVTHLFPEPAVLGGLRPEELPMPRSRARALIGLAAALAAGDVVLDPAADVEATRAKLLALPGIGPWTAGYIEMRALGNPDAFLPTDLGVRRALERLGEPADPAAAERLSERWRPYRAYALQHLWSTLN
ncbi:MAG: AraC family transcriptional regulator [Solirubrobacterales bacterium]|nr:AraC family transcriptional regulator [Solirubrobacterales bacterium]